MDTNVFPSDFIPKMLVQHGYTTLLMSDHSVIIHDLPVLRGRERWFQVNRFGNCVVGMQRIRSIDIRLFQPVTRFLDGPCNAYIRITRTRSRTDDSLTSAGVHAEVRKKEFTNDTVFVLRKMKGLNALGECPICLLSDICDMPYTHSMIQLPCGHAVCSECFIPGVFSAGDLCPLCRQTVMHLDSSRDDIEYQALTWLESRCLKP